MHWIDYTIIFGYLGVVLAIGAYFFNRQSSVDEYFVGNRKMGAAHIGFSVVATDVGGGFSIGLGGLGFAMGLAGSWLLFSGLIGAWMAAVILIPRVKRLGDKFGFLTFPDFLEHRYDGKTRLVAALVSSVGYAAFVGAQVLAGAKLGSAVFDVSLELAVVVMAGVAIIYTAFGGLQAVVYKAQEHIHRVVADTRLLAIPTSCRRVVSLQSELGQRFCDLLHLTVSHRSVVAIVARVKPWA